MFTVTSAHAGQETENGTCELKSNIKTFIPRFVSTFCILCGFCPNLHPLSGFNYLLCIFFQHPNSNLQQNHSYRHTPRREENAAVGPGKRGDAMTGMRSPPMSPLICCIPLCHTERKTQFTASIVAPLFPSCL